MPSTLWVDVEDLFEYALLNPRPSGIQRVEFELCRALAELDPAGERVRFARHAKPGPGFAPVPWPAVERLFGELAHGGGARDAPDAGGPGTTTTAPAPGAGAGGSFARRALRSAAYRLPMEVRHPLSQGVAHQVAVFRSLRAASRAGLEVRRAATTAGGAPAADASASGRAAAPAGGIKSGDVLAVLGSPWFHAGYAGLVRHAQRRGARFALLIYDLIPLRRPEWVEPGLIARFGGWFSGVIPLADAVMTISRASAADVVRHCAEAGLPLRAPPRVIPMGTGFGPPRPSAAPAATGRALPAPGTYALIVSTIEARKNHALLFRVWRRLLEEHPRDAVPTLVFAGREGWLVSDLMQQLRNADFLGGKVVHVEDPTDAELERLYAGCLFTLFPSFYEGWGLPVTESLAFGAPCIASNATSLPEAGGALARYFDPEDATEAFRLVSEAIRDPAGLAAWRERVRREFRPVSWRESAEAVLRAVEG